MKDTKINPEDFVFQYTFKGLFWIGLGVLIVTVGIFVGGVTIWNFESIPYRGIGDVLEMVRETFALLPAQIIYGILITIILIYPVMLIPFFFSTMTLVEWLKKNSEADRLSPKNAQSMGAIAGGLAGAVVILLRVKVFPIWPMIWTYIFYNDAFKVIFWITIYTLSITGALVSGYFSKTTAERLLI
jgi:hypothetical protein